MDFYQIVENVTRKFDKEREIMRESMEIYPDFIVKRSRDLMVRGRSFYAIWDAEKELWSTDEYDVQRLVDAELEAYKEERKKDFQGYFRIKRLASFSSKTWLNFKNYLNQMPDNAHQLDEVLTFSNDKKKKTDYVSRVLPYPLEEGPIEAYDELISTLYNPEERAKLEWAIGAVVSGEAKDIQKFVVLYGEMGSGKSTVLNIIQKLFVGYYTMFDAKALTGSSNAFSTEVFKSNPLVAIQHDGDLSRIEDNTKLNSIVSHEEMLVNEKYKPGYITRMNCFLFMGTNKPVKITDAKSGIIRRLIDVRPSLQKVPPKRYGALVSQIDFELGAIAHHCLQVYREMGKNYYSSYRPVEMMLQTDVFYNFIEANFYTFKEQDGVTLSQAYEIYKTYCDEALVDFKLPRHKFREELKSYFDKFSDMARIDGKQVRSYYSGFLTGKFSHAAPVQEEVPYSLVLDSETSLLDDMLSDCPAQYATSSGTPLAKWNKVDKILKSIDTKKLHYVKVPLEHIVIDFDLKDETGKKSAQLNLEAASKWPSTYAEFSKGGAAIHLHYIYEGDPKKLSRVYDEDIEIKVFSGNSSLRRKLTKCNNIPVATINSGLPLKGEKPVINIDSVQSEKGLRDLIRRNLNKEIHPGTKPSIDFIWKILDDAYKSGLSYDVTDMRPAVLAFANNSSNQASYCIKIVCDMQFKSEETSSPTLESSYESDDFIFFDVEVFPNLFIVVWKRVNGQKVKMINPTPSQMEELFKFKLIGFNCRRYDNHILYARYVGYDNRRLYELSQRIINGSKNAMFGEAYNISYTDVYDFASAGNKMSLKKWEIKLGIHHQELGLPWDQDVPEELWDKVADYCGNDVDATEATFNHLSGDWVARQILAELSGLTVNDTTNQHTIRIVFGNEKHPQSQFIYTDLSEMFPGYKFENGKSTYRGFVVGEGGRVYAEPGMYSNVPVLDVVSMHPTSAIQLNIFGPYTKRFEDLVKGRVSIKHEDYETLKTLLDGKLAPFIEDALGENPKFTLKDVSSGLKTAINSVYGLTSAGFENPFRDPRNIDNIVAKRGALFMIDLQYAVQEKGFTVAHIKTDSIKIPNATKEIMDFVVEFGRKYGYEFEHEETYEKFCLLNDAVYIALSDRLHDTPWGTESYWSGTGAQFNPETNPYVFKTLFSKESIDFADLCETKSVKSVIYLDFNEDLPDVSAYEKESANLIKKLADTSNGLSSEEAASMSDRVAELTRLISEGHSYHFVGKVGAFCPIKPGYGGGILVREQDGKYYAVTGSKGYRWMESEIVTTLGIEDQIDMNYYNSLVDAAVGDVSNYGDFEWFIGNDTSELIDDPIGFNDSPPPCGSDIPCSECSKNDECALLENMTRDCAAAVGLKSTPHDCTQCPHYVRCDGLSF